jgi:DNA-binding transcriptional LysR family regulator
VIGVFDLSCRHIEVILAVARTGAIVSAASMLHISASQTSRLLQFSESQIGCRLFDRSGPKLALNAAGYELLPKLEQLHADMISIRHLGPQLQLGRTGSLTIGFTRLTSLTYLREIVKRCARDLPEAVLRLKVGPDIQMEEELVAGRLDLALLTSPLNYPGIRTLPVHFDPLRLAHTLELGSDPISLAEPRLEAILTAPFNTWRGNWKAILARCHELGLEPKMMETVDDAMGRMVLCFAGPYGALVSEIRRSTLDGTLQLSTIQEFESYGFTTVLASASEQSPLALRLWQLVEAQISEEPSLRSRTPQS